MKYLRCRYTLAEKILMDNPQVWQQAGAQNLKLATALYSCHGLFTDQIIFRLNFPRIKIPKGASLTNHKLRLKEKERSMPLFLEG